MKLILIAITGFLAIFGGGVIAYLLLMAPAGSPTGTSTPAQQTPSGQGTGITPGNNNTQATVTNEPTTTLDVNTEAEFAKTLSTLSATRIQFTAVTSASSSAMGELYDLYKNEITSYKKMFPDSPGVTLHIALVDLNGDSVQEGIVYVDPPGYCGSAGCSLDIYKKQGKTWTQIFSTVAYDIVATLPTMSNSYKDLLLTVQGGEDLSNTRLVVYGWNTETFMEAHDAAVWNGSTFELQ